MPDGNLTGRATNGRLPIPRPTEFVYFLPELLTFNLRTVTATNQAFGGTMAV